MNKVILNIGHGNTVNKKGQRVYDPGAIGNGQEKFKKYEIGTTEIESKISVILEKIEKPGV